MNIYEAEDLDQIEAQHKEGRLLPFVEFPILGGQRVLRMLRDDGLYVGEIGPEEATDFLRCVSRGHDVNQELLKALTWIAEHDLRGVDLTVCGHIAHGFIGVARAAIAKTRGEK